MGRLLDTVKGSELAALATAIGQNRRGEQETGEESGAKEHNECEGKVAYGWSKEQKLEAGIEA